MIIQLSYFLYVHQNDQNDFSNAKHDRPALTTHENGATTNNISRGTIELHKYNRGRG